MRKLIIGSVIALASILVSQTTHAQGTMTYLSNLGHPPAGSYPVASNSWLAVMFTAGTDFNGYVLDSIQLEMADASGNPTNFTAMLYSVTFTSAPYVGSYLGTLDGSLNPATAGTYTFASISIVIPLKQVEYQLVA